MAGYAARTGLAQGVHDPLHVRAIVISDEAITVCLLVCEVICVDPALTTRIRERVGTALALPLARILVAATHTHSGPAGLTHTPALPAANDYLGRYDASLADAWVDACVEAATVAQNARQPVRVLAGSASASGVACNRHHPNGVVDTDVPYLAFQRTSGEVIACLYSIACHPTVLGADNLFYSADLTGAICRQLEARWQGAVVVGLTGAAGDISTRFTRRAATFAEMARLATCVSASFDLMDATLVVATNLMATHTFIKVKRKHNADRQALLQRQQIVQDQIARATNAHEYAPLQAEAMGLRIALNTDGSPKADIVTELQGIRIGDTLMLTFPGEMFVAYGLMVRRWCFPMSVLIAGYANDYIGYVPTDTTDDGYETAMAVVAPGAGTQLLDAAFHLAQDLSVSDLRTPPDINERKEAP